MRKASFKPQDLQRMGALSGQISKESMAALTSAAQHLQKMTHEATEQTLVLRQCKHEEERARARFEELFTTLSRGAA